MTGSPADIAAPGTVASVLVGALRAHGVSRVFCVAGESYLPVLDALYDAADVDVVTCRHEGSAGFAAVADAKLTGVPGVCLVNRGPGATNAAIAVHAALQDAVPLLLIVGQVESRELGREVFQEIDCVTTFATLAKEVVRLYDPANTAELIARALRTAVAGTPGPVVLEVPEDVFDAPAMPREAGPWPRHPVPPHADAMAEVSGMLAAARRPLLLAGGLLDTGRGRALLAETAAVHGLPVVCGNKRQDLYPNRDARYAGHVHNSTKGEQRAALESADLVLAVGSRLDDVTTLGHAFPTPAQNLVHVYPDPVRLGRVHRPAIGLACDPAEFLAALAQAPAAVPESRVAWVERLHGIEAAKAVWTPVTASDGVVFGGVVAALDRLTGGDVVVTVDSGAFTSWVYRYLRLAGAGRLLGISSSAMGFGVPSALAAALRLGRPAVAFVGDGGFVMNGGELATAVERHAPLVVVVADNGSYGTIRLHQENRFPGRTVATSLTNPDFARLAEAYGATGLSVDTDAGIAPALAKALEDGGPVVVHVRTSLRHISAHRVLPEATA
ncbi:thiamine pyrophosphate protein [Actinorhabdospora filicis]|uniref:Thiamine pyrophosphate protein n=1 Tax=Actinorhabdospora filicis TaxID=1785913 RepID=A0A9W6SPB4_9ACTN|nr:thiamine pyrophosphate-dependent enzyme [Actinorhabdospora filicis]GLZ78266.1 thiamine pyrophosphate protein [Actinorhabdospora filicis]